MRANRVLKNAEKYKVLSGWPGREAPDWLRPLSVALLVGALGRPRFYAKNYKFL